MKTEFLLYLVAVVICEYIWPSTACYLKQIYLCKTGIKKVSVFFISGKVFRSGAILALEYEHYISHS